MFLFSVTAKQMPPLPPPKSDSLKQLWTCISHSFCGTGSPEWQPGWCVVLDQIVSSGCSHVTLGTAAIGRTGWSWRIWFQDSPLNPGQAGAGSRQEASVPSHVDFFIKLLQGFHDVISDFLLSNSREHKVEATWLLLSALRSHKPPFLHYAVGNNWSTLFNGAREDCCRVP